MAVDWSLAGNGFDALQSLQVAGQASQQRLAQQRQQAELAAQQRHLQVGQQAGSLAASGDYAGARSAALGAGEWDIATHVSGLEDAHRQQLSQQAGVLGRVAASLNSTPEADRPAQFAALAPQLTALGVTPEELQHADLSDAGLRNYIAIASDTQAALKSYEEQNAPYTLNQGDRRYQGGQMLAENPAAPHFVPVPEGGMLVRTDGGGAAPAMGTPNAQPGGSAWTSAQLADAVPFGGRVTSGVRSAAHNAAIDGAPNSQHVRGTAIDVVFPQGTSVEQVQQHYASLGAPVSVIHERAGDPHSTGDHFHIQGASQQSGPSGVPNIIMGRPKQPKEAAAPSGYRFNGNRLEPIPGGPADSSGASGLSDDALNQAADAYNLTGSLPTGLGRGGVAQRAIIDRAAQRSNGASAGDLVASRAGRKADVASLNRLSVSSGQVLAFENTALRNGAQALRLASKVGNGQSPVFNRWINAGRVASGDPDVAAFNAAIDTFANEYAKVTSSATGGGVTSDSARDHARDLINGALNADQLIAVTRTLSADMHNRRLGIEHERDEISARIRGGGSSAGQPPSSRSVPADVQAIMQRYGARR